MVTTKRKGFLKRKASVRFQISRKSDRLRLSVYRSGRHIYAQIIDDKAHRTLVAASSLEKDLRAELGTGGNCHAAGVVGQRLAERAKEKGIQEVVFDRGGYLYHGRLEALARSAREAGLSF